MIRINDYFDRVLFINLDARADRRLLIEAELAKFGIEADRVEAVDERTSIGGRGGACGCALSHQKALELIITNGWARTLILEDDAQFRFPDTQERFSRYIREVPEDWARLQLAGMYAGPAKRWVGPHVIEHGDMKVNLAYGITLAAAEKMAPFLDGGHGRADDVFNQVLGDQPRYIFEPRLVSTYLNMSDIEGIETNGNRSLIDTTYVGRLMRQRRFSKQQG